MLLSHDLPRLILVLIVLLGTGCGDEPESSPTQSTNPAQQRPLASNDAPDELIVLKPHSVEREDEPRASETSPVAFTGMPESAQKTDSSERRFRESRLAIDAEAAERRNALKTLIRRDNSGPATTERDSAQDGPPSMGALKTIYDRGSIVVRRAAPAKPSAPWGTKSKETDEFLAFIRSGFDEKQDSLDIQIKESVVEALTLESDSEGKGKQERSRITTWIQVSGPSPGDEGKRQINLAMTCTWGKSPTVDSPILELVQFSSYEEILTTANTPLFSDRTEAILGKTPFYKTQTLVGIDTWASRITRIGDMALTGHHGLTVGDVNGDGLDDLYTCDAGSLPNRLYLQQADGSLVDVSRQAGVDFLEDSRSALLVDLDNDGDQDLVVATIAMIVFAENDGSGKFTIRGGHPGARYPFSISAADYDNSGHLDIFVCIYGADDRDGGKRGFEASSPLPFHDATNGGRNVLLKNHGLFRFSDVTDSVGMTGETNTRWSFAASWEDFDRDGDPDLYVANDFGRNNLYRNELNEKGQRVFVDMASESGVEDMASGMSVSWGDVNRDGNPDIYVGNMFSSAGGRVAYEREFAGSRPADTVKALQRMARGNSLFVAQKGEDSSIAFRDLSKSSGVTMGKWAWSSGFVDLNNDGWEDIVVTNGYMTNSRDDDL